MNRAFVVNLHDMLNFDLDFGPDPPAACREAIENPYRYIVREEDRNDLYRHVSAIAHRCRLRNVKKRIGASHEVFRAALHKLMCRIDQQNGWVDVKVGTCDQFRRVLVDFYDPITGEDLSEWMIKTFPDVVQAYWK